MTEHRRVLAVSARVTPSMTTQIYAHYHPSDQEADAVDRAFA